MKKDIMQLLKERQPEIDAIIEEWIPRRLDEQNIVRTLGKPAFVYDVGTATKSVNDLLWDILDRGGKRWRPVLLLLAAEAIGGKGIVDKIKDFVILPEVVHNGTLVVDDVEDGSEMRRGKPCLNISYGVDLAVNAGNSMYFLPLQVLMNNKTLSDKQKVKIYDIYSQEMINVSYGQGFDIYWHKGLADEVSQEQYLQMCAYKTGCLARLAAKVGAVLGGADDETVEAAGKFAEAIGIAFQIQDDLLNLVGEVEKYGKEIGGDITEGKRTLMVIHCLEHADSKQGKRLLSILNMHSREQELIMEAIGIMKRTNSFEYSKSYAKKMVETAWANFEKKLKPSEAKEYLQSFADFMINREV